MVKVVDKGERFCSITLDGSESSITFQEEYLYFSVQNNSDSVVYISLNRDIVPNADGVMAVNAGSSVLFGHMKNANHFFVKGTGLIQIAAANEPINFFVNASTSGGGGTEGDYYTKAQSDAKYVQASNLANVAMSGSYSDLKNVPEKLPADGGNADTVGGHTVGCDVPENAVFTPPDLSGYALLTDVIPYKMGMDFGTCTTAAETVAKSVTTLHKVAPALGAVFAVKFNNAVPARAMLNINGLNGYIQYRGGSIPNGIINAGDIATFIYHSGSGINTFEILSIENGGNADTVDGKHASDFVLASTSQQVNASRIEIPDNVNVGEWLAENAKIGTLYFCTGYEVGQTNLPGGLSGWTWFSFDGNGYYARVMVSDTATKDFILNKVNNVGEWKEISYAPIKSTTFSGTTNEYGNVVFTAVGSKIPLFAECSPYCGIPLRFNDNYWIHCINPITANNSIVANTAVTGTVYYVEI